MKNLVAGCLAMLVMVEQQRAEASPPDGTEDRQESRLRGFPPPPERRPLVELEGAVSLPWAAPDHGLSDGRSFTGILFVRPLPYFAFGPWYEYRYFAWDARREEFRSRDESAWAYTYGGLARGYPLARGLLDPYGELGFGKALPRGSVSSATCSVGADPWVFRFGLGTDVYVMQWARLGVVGSAFVTTTTWSDCLLARPDDPPNPPNSVAGGSLGISLTIGVPPPPSSAAMVETAINP